MSHLKFQRLFPIKDFEGDTMILGYISDSVDRYRVNILYNPTWRLGLLIITGAWSRSRWDLHYVFRMLDMEEVY